MLKRPLGSQSRSFIPTLKSVRASWVQPQALSAEPAPPQIVWASSAKRFVGVSEYLRVFKTFWPKSETGGLENINPNIRMPPIENLPARPAVAGLQFAQLVRTWDENQPG